MFIFSIFLAQTLEEQGVVEEGCRTILRNWTQSSSSDALGLACYIDLTREFPSVHEQPSYKTQYPQLRNLTQITGIAFAL